MNKTSKESQISFDFQWNEEQLPTPSISKQTATIIQFEKKKKTNLSKSSSNSIWDRMVNDWASHIR